MLSHLIALGVLLKSPDFIVAQSLFPSDLKVNQVNVDGSTQAKNPRNYFKTSQIIESTNEMIIGVHKLVPHGG